MKKLLLVVMALLMAGVLLVGCAAPAPAATDDTPAAPAADTPDETDDAAEEGERVFRIGYVNKTLNNPYFVALDDALRAEVESRGWEYVSLNANEDIDAEAANMETFISQGFDLIIMNPVDSLAALAPISRAYEAGIPVIAVDNAPDEAAQVITIITSDNLRNGRQVGLYIGAYFGDEAIESVLLSGVRGAVVSQERRTGLIVGILESRLGISEDEAWEMGIAFEQELMDNGRASNEEAGFAINGQGWGNWTADEGLPAMEDLLVANPNINLVLGENDNMLIGAMVAIENAGREGIRLAAAADAQKEALELIMNETDYLATGDNNPVTIAAKALEIAESVLLDGATSADFETFTRTEAKVFTRENAAQYWNPDAAF